MPKIPTYEQQLNAPRGTALDVSSPATYMPFAGAVNQTGAMLEQRGSKLLQDFDTTTAYNAFNDLQDKTREKTTELVAREGKDAVGVQREYSEFFDKAKDEITKQNLSAFSQREMFSKLADRHKAGDLDSLARHEVVQLKKYQDSVTHSFVSRQTVRAGQMAHDESAVNEIAIGVALKINDDNPGFDNDAKVIAANQTIYTRAVDELISTDTKRAAKMLEVWKDHLGENYTSRKARLKREEEDNAVDNAFTLLKTMNPKNDSKSIAMLNDLSFLKANGIDAKQRTTLLNIFENSVRWNKYQQEEYRRNVTDQTAQAVIKARQDGDFAGARRIISEGAEKGIHATDLLNMESHLASAEAKYTDSDVYNDAQTKIENLEYTKNSQIDILSGVSKEDKAKLKQNMKDLHDNPERSRIIADGMKAYAIEFKNSPEMLAMQPLVDARVREEARKENLSPDAILSRITEISGSMADMTSKGLWGISWLPGGEVISRAPVGQMMETRRGELKSAAETRKNAEGAALPEIKTPQTQLTPKVGDSDFSPMVRDHVSKVLQAKGIKITESNIKKFYQANKVRVDREVGSP